MSQSLDNSIAIYNQKEGAPPATKIKNNSSSAKYKVSYNSPIKSQTKGKRINTNPEQELNGFKKFVDDIDYDYEGILIAKTNPTQDASRQYRNNKTSKSGA